jgi:hypothetical protein
MTRTRLGEDIFVDGNDSALFVVDRNDMIPHAGAPVARLKPIPQDDRFEVLWWRRDAWGSAGPFGAGLSLNDALAFIASEPPFWIRA